MGWIVATPQPLYPQERQDTHCIGGWVGPRAGLHKVQKMLPQPGFNPQTIQPVVSCYTNYVIPAPINKMVKMEVPLPEIKLNMKCTDMMTFYVLI